MIARPRSSPRGGATNDPLVSQIVRHVPADLKARIRADVDQTGTNMNDVVVGILAHTFAVAFEPTGRRSAGVGGSTSLLLKMPGELRRKIKLRAVQAGSNQRDVIVKVLADHYGTRFRTAPRRARRPAAAAA